MSVIVARALPDVRDGLKPVHRRILFAMHQMGMGAGSPYRKSATVVGEVLGKYHPHGDVPVYEAAVRLAQDFSMRYPLVDGQGNYGSVDGDPPAAMRYTEMRLAKIAESMLVDIDKQTVDYTDNFDATLKEPSYLPALLPNLLLMGSEGIAVGMATKIPPHNLKEVVAAAIDTIKKGRAVISQEVVEQEAAYFIGKIDKIAAGSGEDLTEEDLHKLSATFESDITLQELVGHIPGPDFPTGGAHWSRRPTVLWAPSSNSRPEAIRREEESQAVGFQAVEPKEGQGSHRAEAGENKVPRPGSRAQAVAVLLVRRGFAADQRGRPRLAVEGVPGRDLREGDGQNARLYFEPAVRVPRGLRGARPARPVLSRPARRHVQSHRPNQSRVGRLSRLGPPQ
jgi:hypothetical protein